MAFKVVRMLVVLCVILVGVSFSQTYASDVYVMHSGNDINMSLISNALTDAGHSVTPGLSWYEQDGSQSLSDYDAVVFLNSYTWRNASMPIAGQQEILNYVSGGGGMVTGEWFVWNLGSRDAFSTLATLSPVIPASYDDYNSGETTTYTQVTPDLIINNGLPASLSFTLADIEGGAETVFRPKSEATVFYSSSNGGGVADSGGLVGWDYGLGRVISFSTVIGDSEMIDENYRKLFVNSVEWSVAPEPVSSTLFLLGSAVLGLFGYKRKRA